MSGIALKDLLEAGVHFGHQTKRWNPKMKQYIFGERNGIYIIDLAKTARLFKEAEEFVHNLAADGRHDPVRRARSARPRTRSPKRRSAAACIFVNQRWLGGLLTNFTTIQRSLARLRDLEAMETDGRYETHHQEGNRAGREGKEEAAEEPRRDPQHVAAARRGLRRRHPQGKDRGRRGAQAEDSGDRRGRHQLRSRRSRTSSSPATTTRCGPSACSRRRSPTRSSSGRGIRESSHADDDGGDGGDRRRRTPAAPAAPTRARATGDHPGVGLETAR